ncbi:GNAT family N-acetyltransferase [Planctomycetota bacterium]
MTPTFLKVTDTDHISRVAQAAHEIWNEHFPKVISQAQIDYMVERFQSEVALLQQIQDGMQYYLIVVGEKDAGYYAIQPQNEGRLFLSKLYIRQAYRGQGLARATLADIEHRGRNMNRQTLWLTCNRRNTEPIAVYEHLGFKTVDTVIMDIGEGFVMDDYRMEKDIT